MPPEQAADRTASGAAPGAEAAPAADPARARLLEEFEKLQTCGSDPDWSCPVFAEFAQRQLPTASVAEEDLLLQQLERPDKATRLAILIRLVRQAGPRNQDPQRRRKFFQISRSLTQLTRAEANWLGRAIGATDLSSADARKETAELIDETDAALAAAIVVGIGVTHPHEAPALDLIDARRHDFRPEVRHATLDAYAETSEPDYARACASWAAALGDKPMEDRGAALLAVSKPCAAHHQAVFNLVKRRLSADPSDLIVASVSGLCSSPRFAAETGALARKTLPRSSPTNQRDLLMLMARCDKRGPRAPLAPYLSRQDELGRAARHVLADVERDRE